MTDIIKALDKQTNRILIGHLEYSKEWGENIFYEIEGKMYFEQEITLITTYNDCRFPTIERRRTHHRESTSRLAD